MFNDIYPDLQVSYKTYRKIFNSDFNISFGYPRTDTCLKCDEIKISIEKASKDLSNNPDSEQLKQALQKLQLERDVHQRKADTFYRRKREARLKASKDPNFEVITIDFNKNLSLPNITTNDFYYRRKLTFLSFNIHLLSSNEVFIYSYDETIAKKGADEVTSILFHFFMNHLSGEIKHLELFCDSCAGQNKNYTMIRFLDFLVNQRERFDSIKISFPERGHSYLECDKDMGLINCKAHASTPSDWHEIFRAARKNPSPYNVIEQNQDMVKNMTQFLKPVYKAGFPVPMRPLKEVMFSKKSLGVISHRDSWNGPILNTTILSNARRSNKAVNIGEPVRLYIKKIIISLAKYKDLQVLKKFTSAPEFYDSLEHDETNDDPLDDLSDD
ncbi:uncharacterized protein LOC136089483 [Hydra vulgaris]|uniref:Uncharacterized protein LOC136089483 n=1 Tax=Hydra vulgaris TaxID=6087 RepID=A0ABM4DB40_HYDVU